jgi:endonuclease/exonuclease/phosphatase family metal-dependent hydrolase
MKSPVLAALALLLPTAAVAAAPVTLRVFCYNIHHGEGLDGRVDLERIARLITDQRADLVALQEVERGTTRTGGRDLAAELGRLTGLTPHFVQNIPYQGGAYGIAVLSRFPIKRTAHTLLRKVGDGEQRGVQHVVVEVQGRELLFLNTHLDHRRDPAERDQSAEELRRIVAAAGATPVILCGDFNATPDSTAIRRLREFLTDTWSVVGQGPGHTVPVRKPTRRIDYIWVSSPALVPRKMEVLLSEASDHLPIVAEIQLR